MTDDRLVRPKEAAKILSCHRSHLYNLCRRGKLRKPIQIGPGQVAWRMSTLQDFIDEMEALSLGTPSQEDLLKRFEALKKRKEKID